MTTTSRIFAAGLAFVLFAAFTRVPVACAQDDPQYQSEDQNLTGFSLLGAEIEHDFKYLANNMEMDAVDIGTAPLHVADDDSILRSPTFYIGLASVAGLVGGSFALDQTVRARLRGMKSSTATDLQDISYAGVFGACALAYGYGLYTDNYKARETILTAGEAAGIATLVAEFVFKPAFGRLRPHQDHHSHTAFFDGGQSFVSGEVTPVFAAAAGISEAADNKWYIALPAYSLAMADGFGRMGHDAHWLSDVVGAAALGWATTELLIYLHRNHEVETDRWRIFTESAPQGHGNAPAGVGVAYSW